MKETFTARLFFNDEHVDIICENKAIAEDHLLKSVWPQGDFHGGKLLINGEVERVYGWGI